MTNAEIIQVIRKEIERLKNHAISSKTEFIHIGCTQNAFAEDCRITSYNHLLSFLSDLEKSEKPMNQEGLEEEIERYLHSLGVGYGGWVDGMEDDDLRGIARHFYDLGCRRTAEKYDELEYNRQRAEESPLPEDTVLFNNGVEEGKRLMMEEAVEGEVMLNPYPTICLDDCKDYDFKDGDKVRVIIVKED